MEVEIERFFAQNRVDGHCRRQYGTVEVVAASCEANLPCIKLENLVGRGGAIGVSVGNLETDAVADSRTDHHGHETHFDGVAAQGHFFVGQIRVERLRIARIREPKSRSICLKIKDLQTSVGDGEGEKNSRISFTGRGGGVHCLSVSQTGDGVF